MSLEHFNIQRPAGMWVGQPSTEKEIKREGESSCEKKLTKESNLATRSEGHAWVFKTLPDIH